MQPGDGKLRYEVRDHQETGSWIWYPEEVPLSSEADRRLTFATGRWPAVDSIACNMSACPASLPLPASPRQDQIRPLASWTGEADRPPRQLPSSHGPMSSVLEPCRAIPTIQLAGTNTTRRTPHSSTLVFAALEPRAQPTSELGSSERCDQHQSPLST